MPSLAIIIMIALIPILFTLWLSLHSINLKSPEAQSHFIGLSNYIHLLKDGRMWRAVWQTLAFTVTSVGIELVLGLVLALILNKTFKLRGMCRASILIPWAIPTVVAALLWTWIFNDQYGAFNDILNRIGIIRTYKSWLGIPPLAFFSIIVAEVWKTTPFMALMLLAGLQMIPKDLYEAARIDGASKSKQFLFVTLPLLKPIILVALLFRTLDAFRVFDLIYVMTAGGPGNSTEVLSLYTYKTLFSYLDFGYGSALSFVTFAIAGVISIIYIRLLKGGVE